uniref:Leucine-rich repeat-containing N-terminal plant-type domain-containing protein n=1 Tax=Arcella intermedia TaxID=1963864 RepID=A0A6B2LU13_9EUKA
MLDFHNNQLSGTLPSSIGNLVGLTFLLLNENAISGSLPPSIGDMSSLQGLELSESAIWVSPTNYFKIDESANSEYMGKYGRWSLPCQF